MGVVQIGAWPSVYCVRGWWAVRCWLVLAPEARVGQEAGRLERATRWIAPGLIWDSLLSDCNKMDCSRIDMRWCPAQLASTVCVWSDCVRSIKSLQYKAAFTLCIWCKLEYGQVVELVNTPYMSVLSNCDGFPVEINLQSLEDTQVGYAKLHFG